MHPPQHRLVGDGNSQDEEYADKRLPKLDVRALGVGAQCARTHPQLRGRTFGRKKAEAHGQSLENDGDRFCTGGSPRVSYDSTCSESSRLHSQVDGLGDTPRRRSDTGCPSDPAALRSVLAVHDTRPHYRRFSVKDGSRKLSDDGAHRQYPYALPLRRPHSTSPPPT